MAKIVEQIDSLGNLINDYDQKESSSKKLYEMFSEVLNADVIRHNNKNLLQYGKNIIVFKQVTYLGNPHPLYKKRVQIPKWFPEIYKEYTSLGYKVFFMGTYSYEGNMLLFNFHLDTYIGNKSNNSSAHVLINDIYQATKNGYYKKIDKNNNVIECFKPEYFDAVINNKIFENKEFKVIDTFNKEFEFNKVLHVMKCVPEMYEAEWPDRNQGEWPGFYLEYRYDKFLKQNELEDIMQFQKVKTDESFDFDIFFPLGDFYGDLKSSTNEKDVSPGNDKESLDSYLMLEKKFWYLVYEHDTVLAKNNENKATIAWNEFRYENGYKKLNNDVKNGKIDWMLSYKNRLKESVTYTGMFVLEINNANKHLVFLDFNQGQQPDGAKRKGKYMIKKEDVDNFIVYRY